MYLSQSLLYCYLAFNWSIWNSIFHLLMLSFFYFFLFGIMCKYYWYFSLFIDISTTHQSSSYRLILAFFFYVKKRTKYFPLTDWINTWFERISMTVIFFNCVTLGMYQPCVDESCSTNRCKILQVTSSSSSSSSNEFNQHA